MSLLTIFVEALKAALELLEIVKRRPWKILAVVVPLVGFGVAAAHSYPWDGPKPGPSPLFSGPVEIGLIDEATGERQIWTFDLKGSENITGTFVDRQTGTKGVAAGYFRDNKLSLSYGSEDPSRPGIGSIVLGRELSSVGHDPAIFSGVAVVNDCQCTGRNMTPTGKVKTLLAILTPTPTLPAQETPKQLQTDNLPVPWSK